MIKIKFGTDGWRAIIADDYTVENVARVTKAVADWLHRRFENPAVVIGHDCRFGGTLFSDVATRVFCANGVKVHRAKKFASTPMVSLATVLLKAQQGIVITASHNPPSYNGYKLKDYYGGPTAPDLINEVENLIPDTPVAVPQTDLATLEAEGLLQWHDLEQMYFDEVSNKFDLAAMRRLSVAYDAMYGAGQDVLPRILPSATLLHCDFNPSFKGQAPEPLHKNLQELSQLLKEGNYHAGLANDGDADRIGMYDERGNFVDAHHIILLLIHYMAKYKNMSGKVVAAFSVTDRVKKMCAHYNLPCQITKIGFKYICEIMNKEDVLVGGEESGGIAVKGHIPERDGIWMGLLLFELMAVSGKKLSELIAEVYDIVGAFVYDRNDLHINEALKQKVLRNCQEGVYHQFGKYQVRRIENIDGYKFHFDNDAWMMIRASGTEPVLRVYAEAADIAAVNDILSDTKAVLLA